MGIASGIKDITQEIASSYEVRMVEVGKLKDEAKKMLKSFHASQKEMGTQLRKDLAQDNAKIKSEVKAMRNGFQSSHKEMGSTLRKDLAGHTQELRGEVAKMRGELRASQREMSAQLRKELTQGVAARKSEAKDMLGDFQRSRKQASAQLRRELADYVQGIKKEVTSMWQETRADLRQASATWQELASTMRAKRGAVKVPPKVEVPVPKEKVPVEEEIPDLEAKLLAAIREHPAGITLAEVAKSLGVVPVVLGRASRKLLDEGKIRKEDKDYFPVSTE
jgi:uncharacterized protein YicC (UPF0701 family)